ncbi:MAG: C39 family peptidase [Oscillospiraceae bacterium]
MPVQKTEQLCPAENATRHGRRRHLAANILFPLLLCLGFGAFVFFALWGADTVANAAKDPPPFTKAQPAANAQALRLPEASSEAPADGATSALCILQNPELPNGCEATSLAMALNHWGFAADKMDIAYNYIPREDFAIGEAGSFGPDPHAAYAGDPGSSFGFYCLAAPVAEGANRYLQAQQSHLVAQDVSGADQATLEGYLNAGQPVIFWMTLDGGNAAYAPRFRWQLPNGEEYRPFSNLHCVLLTGHGNGLYHLLDPLVGPASVDSAAAFESYLGLGANAVVITPAA